MPSRIAALLGLTVLHGCALSFDQFDPVGPDAGLLCPPGFWEVAAATPTTVQVCDRLTVCTESEYESVAPTNTSDRVCAPLTVCPEGTYVTVLETETSDRSCSYRNCLDLLTRAPSTPDGSYEIDPDGLEGNPPVLVTCDMTNDGGGWTVIAQESFTDGAPGWSDPRTATCGSVTVLGGPNNFGAGAASSKAYSLLGVAHTEARLSLRYWRFESWDGELAIVRIDGVDVFAMGSGGFPCSTTEPGQEFGVNVGVAHSTDPLTVFVGSTLDEASDNESFGIDNLLLRVR